MTRKHILRLAFLLCFLGSSAHGQTGIAGEWYGTLNVNGGVFAGGATLSLIFHVTETEDGYSTIMETPAFDSTTPAETSIDGDSVTFTVESMEIEYVGTISGNMIVGTFTQEGLEVPNFAILRDE